MLVAASVSQFRTIMRQLPVEVFLSEHTWADYMQEVGEATYHAGMYAQSGMEAIRVLSWPLLADDTAICYGRI